MAKSFKLSSIGGVAVAGAALGLYLGSSAISEINPAYYSTPLAASRFHGDLVPNPGDRDSAQPLPELAEVATDLGSGCVSCSLSFDDEPLFEYPPVNIYRSEAAPADLVVAEAEEHVSRGLSPRDARDIERYAHFPVSEDEERPALAIARVEERSVDTAAADGAEELLPAI